ncbi:MAG: sugar ABC transporter permease [Chloroflexota bacterium]
MTVSLRSAPSRGRSLLRGIGPRSFAEAQWTAYLYLLPALLLFLAFVIYPMMQGAWISFLDWNGFSPPTWVGLDNYVEILRDGNLRAGFVRSVILILFYSLLPIALGLLITAILSSRPIRGASWFRGILFLPQVLPIVVVGIVWRWMYAPDGPINAGLTSIGLGGLATGWLGDFTLALPAVGMVGTWVSFGFVMVLLLTGAQAIPSDLYDAARVDGAGRVQEFFAITLPGLHNQLVVALIVTIITALRAFGLIYTMTSGGPGYETTVPAWNVYTTTFRYHQVGLGAALGITLAVLIFVIVFALGRLVERERR